MAEIAKPILSLNWRDDNARDSRIIAAIHHIMLKIDAGDTSVVEFAATKSKKAIQLEEIEHDGEKTWMLVRRSNPSPRGYDAHEDFWIRFITIGIQILEMMGNKEPIKYRRVQYQHLVDGLTYAQITKGLKDWAVTIRVHPKSFGLQNQPSGEVWLAHGLSIAAKVVNNIFEYRATEKTDKVVLRETKGIPDMIASLRVVKRNRDESTGWLDIVPRGVIVTEHRNIGLALTEIQRRFSGMIIVMTGGFPDSSTTEFLHLLEVDPLLKDLPFLFFSDHDFSAFQMFIALKYGSAHAAWASPSQVCKRLTWAGPTIDELYAAVHSYASGPRIEVQRRNHPDRDIERLQEENSLWEEAKVQEIANVLTSRKITKADHLIIKGLRNAGCLALEPKLNAEIEYMLSAELEGKSKFGLAQLARIRSSGMELWIADEVDRWNHSEPEEDYEERAPAENRSQDTRRFVQAAEHARKQDEHKMESSRLMQTIFRMTSRSESSA
ncbi:MAG: hypothetical protein M1819_002484 [Sarea resinae]|nr:MAG: hypothetical protein M1819_002484 [Sarea resinae]